MKEMVIEFDFAWIEIQGRGAKGTTLTAHKVDRVVNTPRDNGAEENESADSRKEKKSPAVDASEAKTTAVKSPPPVKEEKAKSASPPSQDAPEKEKDGKNQATFEF